MTIITNSLNETTDAHDLCETDANGYEVAHCIDIDLISLNISHDAIYPHERMSYPMRVHSGHLRRYDCDGTPNAVELLSLVKDPAFLSLVERLVSLIDEDRTNRDRLVFTDSEEAADIEHQISAAIRELDSIPVLNVADYYGALGSDEEQARVLGVAADMDDDELFELASDEASDCAEGYLDEGDIVNYLQELRQRLIDTADDSE